MIIVFDANCLLCSGWVQFLLRHDRKQVLRFASMQTDGGRALLDRAGIDALAPDTFLLVDGDRLRTQTHAIFHVLHALGWPWRFAWVLWIIPAPLRDAAYRSLARNRYRWFGRRETCWLPSPEHDSRFIR
jgi:predicted DCC family thiol-disulfide oxidoreductase YuxK